MLEVRSFMRAIRSNIKAVRLKMLAVRSKMLASDHCAVCLSLYLILQVEGEDSAKSAPIYRVVILGKEINGPY